MYDGVRGEVIPGRRSLQGKWWCWRCVLFPCWGVDSVGVPVEVGRL